MRTVIFREPKMSELLDKVMSAGFPLDAKCVIHLFIGGSQLHGAKISGYDDLDIYGCYVEPPPNILGISDIEHFVWSSGSQSEKNTADDVDVTMYSLHRWGELLMKGNPAILHYLFAENHTASSTWNRFILPHRKSFISKKAANQYLGFANSQRMRLTGERGMGRHGQRLDLVEKYGFDTKFAMHFIRLLYECRELVIDQKLTFPRPEKDNLIEIRTGKYTLDEVFRLGEELRSECEARLAESAISEQVDKQELSKILADAYLAHWAAI